MSAATETQASRTLASSKLTSLNPKTVSAGYIRRVKPKELTTKDTGGDGKQKDVALSEERKANLRKQTPILVSMVKFGAVFGVYLIRNNVIRAEQLRTIKATANDDQMRTLELLKALEDRPESAYDGLKKCLKDTDQAHLAVLL